MTTNLTSPIDSDNSITALLTRLTDGDPGIEGLLAPRILAELRKVAARYMRSERLNHTLQPTALVNEAYLRLVQQPHAPWQNRAHFFGTAAHLMREILVDHARLRTAKKRGGPQQQVTLDEALVPSQEKSIDILALHEALERLAVFDGRQGRIVELHFFGGLSFEEIALVLHSSERTVKREWIMARAWLKQELSRRS